MTKSIVVSVSYECTDEYDAPEGWDDMTQDQKDEWIDSKITETTKSKPEWLNTIIYEDGHEIREEWS